MRIALVVVALSGVVGIVACSEENGLFAPGESGGSKDASFDDSAAEVANSGGTAGQPSAGSAGAGAAGGSAGSGGTQPGAGGAHSGGSGGTGGGTGGHFAGGEGGVPNGGSSGTGQSGASGTQDAGSGGASISLTEFSLCGDAAQCASKLSCRQMDLGGVFRCTRPCSTSSQCMTGTRCGKAGFCAFDDVGTPCSDPNECSAFCVAGPGANYCTSGCVSASDCPAGWGCSPPIGGTRICLRLDAECSTASDCAGGLCDSSTIVSSCSMACTAAGDCPQRASSLEPWSCSNGSCARPADIYGPVSKDSVTLWACNLSQQTVDLCADGMTNDTAPSLTCQEIQPVPTTGLCVSSCLPSGGCGAGFVCVGGAKINGADAWICVKSGFNEVGAPCSKNEDCLFARCQAGVCSRDCTKDSACPSGFSCKGGSCL